MQVVHVELGQQAVRVVVAVHAHARDPQAGERLDPRPVEVAEQDDRVDVQLLGHQRGIERRPLVGEREDAHQASSSTAAANTSVCRSTSAAVVAGDISAMLWKGVIITPRLSA